MPARLTLYPQDRPAQRHLLDPGREYLIGRDAGCDLSLDDRRLSRRHARLACSVDRWRIRDLDSKNGIQLDGRDVVEAPLDDGSWLSIGGLLARFELPSDERLTAEHDLALARRATALELRRRLDPDAAVDTLLGLLLASVLELADAERAFVMLADGHGELTLRARLSRAGAADDEASFPGSTGAVRRALEERRPLVVCDARADAFLGERPSVAAQPIRALACLPLSAADGPQGVVYLDSSSPGKVFTELDLELLEAFVAHAALAIGAAALREELAGLLPAGGTRV